jgi:hypothetical protein
MSTFSVLVFDPVLPVNATGDDLIDRLQLPDSLLSSEHLPRGGPDTTAEEYDHRRLLLIGAPPTTPNGSFLDGSKRQHDSLEQSFVALLNAWTLAASASGSTAATAGDSTGEDSTPPRADRLTRLQAARVNSEAVGKGTLFLERLRQEDSCFRSLGEFPIGGFLCVTSVATEADTATPFGAIVNIPSVGSDAESMAIEDLGLVAGEKLGDPIPVNPSAVSFLAGSLRDATRGSTLSDRPLERWTSHEEHVGFLQGHKLCRSVIAFGD